MLRAVANEDVLKANGDYRAEDYPSPADWNMVMFPQYRHPSNKDSRYRPTIDASTPFNPSDERHVVRSLAIHKGLANGFSLSQAHLSGVPEEALYATLMSSYDCARYGWLLGSVWAVTHLPTKYMQSQVYWEAPHTWFAHKAIYQAWLLRTQAALLVGCWGYFYSYEFMYTYVPGLAIRDPTPNGHIKCWEEGQTTFGARAIAGLLPGLGWAIAFGSRKKLALHTFYGVGSSLLFEATRYLSVGQKAMMMYKAQDYSNNMARTTGTLTPDVYHKADPDTGRIEHLSQYRFMRLGHGKMSHILQNSQVHEEKPMVRGLTNIANPYFNWQKARQGWNDAPVKVKNDLWDMPRVMDAAMRAGQNDVRPAY